MEKLKAVIEKYNSDAIIHSGTFNLSTISRMLNPIALIEDKEYTVNNFPEPLEQPIKDYIDCRFEVIKEDNSTITFKA